MTVYNAFDNCGTPTAATGVKCIPDIGAPAKPFLTTADFEIDTLANAQLMATHTAGIAAQTVFPLPLIDELSDNSEDDERYTAPITKLQRKISKGKTIHQYMFPFDPSLHSRLQAFDGATMRYYYADMNNNLTGTSPDGVIFKGFEVTVDLGKWTVSDGGGTPSHTPIIITYVNNDERESDIAIVPVEFNIKGLNGVLPANLSVVSASGTSIVVDVAVGNSALTGLTETTQFLYLQADGETQEAVTVVAESASIPGRYTLTGAAFVTGGTLNLGTPSDPIVTLGTAYYKGTAETVTF